MAVATQKKFESLGLTTSITEARAGCKVVSYTSDAGPDKPVMTLIHGYPQSAYIWRHIVPELKNKVSLFVPELPGYGISSLLSLSSGSPSHLSIGLVLLSALGILFPGPRHLILGGHDRGARICHRLAVAFSSPTFTNPNDDPDTPSIPANLALRSCVLLDIIPTRAQWSCFSSADRAVRYFHWPFLASPGAEEIIQSYGGARWCHNALARLQGANEEGRKRFAADEAWDVYTELFAKKETIVGSCLDYQVGAEVECQAQEEDMARGRKVSVGTLVLYSQKGLGSMTDVKAVWRDWVDAENGAQLKVVGVADGYGHYLPEECPAEIVKAMDGWLP